MWTPALQSLHQGELETPQLLYSLFWLIDATANNGGLTLGTCLSRRCAWWWTFVLEDNTVCSTCSH